MNQRPESVVNVLIYDEYPLIRKGVVHLLRDREDVCVVGETGSITELFSLTQKGDAELVIMSIDAVESSGLSVVSELRKLFPDLAILALSRREESKVAGAALQAGAKGFLSKFAPPEELQLAISTLIDGDVAISDTTSDILISRLSGLEEAPGDITSLSRRELEVLELTGCGLGRGEIAERLNLSARTVDSYRARMKNKLGLKNMPALVRYAVGWLESGKETMSQ